MKAFPVGKCYDCPEYRMTETEAEDGGIFYICVRAMRVISGPGFMGEDTFPRIPEWCDLPDLAGGQ